MVDEAGLNGPPPVTGGAEIGGIVPPVTGGAVVVVVEVVEVVDVVDVVDVVEVVGVTAAHVGPEITLPSRVTPPFRAKARPFRVAPVFIEMEVRARMLPTKDAVVPRLAELPTCQKTLQGCTPPVKMTWLAGATVKVETLWKMKTELASPESVSVPVSDRPLLAA